MQMFLPLEIAKVKSFSYLDPLTGVDPRMSRTLTESLNDEVQRHVKSYQMYNDILIDEFNTSLFKVGKGVVYPRDPFSALSFYII